MMRDIDTLLYWIREREAIRRRKERGAPWPWTKDKILQEWRFTNVRREDDAVTQWIAWNIRQRYKGHEFLYLMLCIARMINWPDTLAELITKGAWPTGLNFDPERMTEVLSERQARGEKVFTGAYKIPAISDRKVEGFGWPKVRQVAEVFIGTLWDQELHNAFADCGWVYRHPKPTLQAWWTWLTHRPGWGPFLAYQAAVDMRFTPLLDHAPDRDGWAAAGPGTIRGLNRLHGRKVSVALSQHQALTEMRRVASLLRKELPEIAFDFSDVPNVLCEYDKYVRVRNGEGTPRTRYVPGQSNWSDVEPVLEAAE